MHDKFGPPTGSKEWEEWIDSSKGMNMKTYTIGAKRIALFGGTELWPILDPEGQQICVTTGPRLDAERLVAIMNALAVLADRKE